VSAIVGKYVMWLENHPAGEISESGTVTHDLGSGFYLVAIDYAEDRGMQKVISLAASPGIGLMVFDDMTAGKAWLAGDNKRVLRLVKGEDTR
jgi:hypothetical protein